MDIYDQADQSVSDIAVIYMDAGCSKEQAREYAQRDYADNQKKILASGGLEGITSAILELGDPPDSSAELEKAENDYETSVETYSIIRAMNEADINVSDTSYRLISNIYNNLHGNPAFGHKPSVKLESLGLVGNERYHLGLKMEDSAKLSMRNLWEKLKAAVMNQYNKLKKWYMQAFDATSRLGKRAKALQSAAEAKQGTIKETRVKASGISVLCIDGKVPAAEFMVSSSKVLADITTNFVSKNAAYYTKMLEKLVDDAAQIADEAKKLEPGSPSENANANDGPSAQDVANAGSPGEGSQSVGNADFVGKLQAMVGEIKANFEKAAPLEPWTDAGGDERFADVAKEGVNLYKTQNKLPGDKMYVLSTIDSTTLTTDNLRSLRMAIGGTVEPVLAKPREVEDSGEFPTLNQTQIATICETVANACSAVMDYKMLFVERDKVFTQMDNKLSSAVNGIEGLEGKALALSKTMVDATTKVAGKINSMESKWIKYAMGVFTKQIDLCQASLNQIG